jgi:hypothetical protein
MKDKQPEEVSQKKVGRKDRELKRPMRLHHREGGAMGMRMKVEKDVGHHFLPSTSISSQKAPQC